MKIIVTRKSIKNMYLRVVDENTVAVSCPRRISEKAVREFVESRRDWIEKTARKQRERREKDPVNAWKSGRMFLWGMETDRVFSGIGEMPPERNLADTDMEKLERRVIALYRKEVERAVKELAPCLEKRVGKSASAWKVRKMKSRWGSCQPKTGEIHISLWLAAYPKECLEYVMIHELAHLYVADHGPRFKAYMDRFLPDWRERRRYLNRTASE